MNGNIGTSERRKDARVPHEQNLTVKVIASTTPAIRPGRTIECASHDVSPDGLRIKTVQPVPSDVYLELWVVAPHQADTLILRGIVRWSRELAPGEHVAGVELIPDSASNIERWRAMVAGIVQAAGGLA
jgi:hypothetical protein